MRLERRHRAVLGIALILAGLAIPAMALIRFRLAALRAFSVATLIAAEVLAQPEPCNARAPQVQFVSEALRTAVKEGDLNSAKDYADRARRQLDQLAAAALRCGCMPAHAGFDSAAARLREAWDAEFRRDLRDTIGRAAPTIDDAMQALRNCAK